MKTRNNYYIRVSTMKSFSLCVAQIIRESSILCFKDLRTAKDHFIVEALRYMFFLGEKNFTGQHVSWSIKAFLILY